MVFSAKGFSFLTGLSGFLCCFFPFPDEREKDNPPSAERYFSLACVGSKGRCQFHGAEYLMGDAFGLMIYD